MWVKGNLNPQNCFIMYLYFKKNLIIPVNFLYVFSPE